MNRDRWLLLASILMFAGMAVYYSRPIWRAWFTAKRPPASAPQLSAPTSMPALQLVIDEDQAGAGAGVGGELVDESTPWGRNPFLTPEEEAGGKSPPADGLQVKTIIVGWPKPVATIDGRTVLVGEKIGEETVAEIRPDAVVLERGGHRRVLKVSEPSITVEVKEVKK